MSNESENDDVKMFQVSPSVRSSLSPDVYIVFKFTFFFFFLRASESEILKSPSRPSDRSFKARGVVRVVKCTFHAAIFVAHM